MTSRSRILVQQMEQKRGCHPGLFRQVQPPPHHPNDMTLHQVLFLDTARLPAGLLAQPHTSNLSSTLMPVQLVSSLLRICEWPLSVLTMNSRPLGVPTQSLSWLDPSSFSSFNCPLLSQTPLLQKGQAGFQRPSLSFPSTKGTILLFFKRFYSFYF